MKIVEVVDLIANGSFPSSREWKKACADVVDAIGVTDWPHGSGKFTIFPGDHANGVVPIKEPCINRLVQLKWQAEKLPVVYKGILGTGDLDALIQTPAGWIGFEWETGNISSSHRALNKLLLTLMKGYLAGGFLVVPSNSLYAYLTDRIGNVGELRPYLPLWSSVSVRNGALRILVVEHDATSKTVARIRKGTDGRAKK